MILSSNKKILLILRHGKAIEKIKEISDHDRDINKRGKDEGSEIGKLLKHIDLVPDYIISSTAKRAIHTAEIVAGFSGYKGKINQDPSLYYRNSVEQYTKVLGNTPDSCYRVLIVGHNPSVENLIERLTNRIEIMGTCYLARVDINLMNWKEIDKIIGQKGELHQVWRPNTNDDPLQKHQTNLD